MQFIRVSAGAGRVKPLRRELDQRDAGQINVEMRIGGNELRSVSLRRGVDDGIGHMQALRETQACRQEGETDIQGDEVIPETGCVNCEIFRKGTSLFREERFVDFVNNDCRKK